MRKALIACGGTGGHLSPGIALAEELTARDWECRLLISKKEVDSRLLRKYPQFQYEALSGSGFSASPLRFARFAADLAAGVATCIRRIRQHRPDVVIGFGGFLSMPALLAGYLCRIPVAIHEANQIPGRVTRAASRFADRVYLPAGVSLRKARPGCIREMGMPVRREIQAMDKSEAKARLGFDPRQKLLFVMGGSQGAESLNRWLGDSLDALAEQEIQAFCLTGSSASEGRTEMRRSSSGADARFVFQRFSDEMALPLSAADLVVSRAGAGSIAEIVRCRAPAILVPYPLAADDHQRANARAFVALGCGAAIEQAELPSLLGAVKEMIGDEAALARARARQEEADRLHAQVEMSLDLERLARGEEDLRAEKERASSHG